jgi:hypothetical protein
MWKILSTLALCIGLASTPAKSQTKVNLPVRCETPEIVANILEKYQEKLVFIGLDNQHNVQNLNLSVFLNKETKTYSVFFTVPDKRLICVLSSGDVGELVDSR